GSTLVVDVNLRGKHFERFRGDGKRTSICSVGMVKVIDN
ncbi:hypothetical protein SS7213T_03055, partial [Staphylococcus simiae CCM 7213 = CCUG 51256]